VAQTTIGTFCDVFRRALATNAATNGFTALASTLTEPTTATDGVIDLAPNGFIENNNLLLIPFGAGSATNTFKIRIVGWAKANPAPLSTSVVCWIPIPLYQFTCTLSTFTGIATGVVLNTDKLCDTIAITLGNELTDCSKISPANSTAAVANVPGQVMVDVKGWNKIQILIDTGGVATNGNCLYRAL